MFKSYDRKPLGCGELANSLTILLIAAAVIYLATHGNLEKSKSDQDVVEGDVPTLSSSPSLINGCQVINQISSDEYKSILGVGAYDPHFPDGNGDGCAYNPDIVDRLFADQLCQYGQLQGGSVNLEANGSYVINSENDLEQVIAMILRGICTYPDGTEMNFERRGKVIYSDDNKDNKIDSYRLKSSSD